MSAKRFLDTNLFIYQLDRSDPAKSEIADALIGDAIANGTGCISYQVVQECINVIVKKARVPLSLADATNYLDNVLTPLVLVGSNIEMVRQALTLQARYQYGFYDSLIIAGALEAGCTELATEDLQNGQKIGSLTVRNPFG